MSFLNFVNQILEVIFIIVWMFLGYLNAKVKTRWFVVWGVFLLLMIGGYFFSARVMIYGGIYIISYLLIKLFVLQYD